MNQLTQNSRQSLSPLRWVPSLYFAMGLPFVVLNMVSAVLFKDLGISDAQIAFWTSLIMWPWTIKFLWSPFLELYRTKKFWVVGSQLLSGVLFGVAALSLQLPLFFSVSVAVFAVVAFSGATHDIAADGVYMSELSPASQAKYIGWQGAFYNLAKLVATGGLVWLAGWLYEGFSTSGTASFDAYVRSWTVVLLILCVTLVALGLYHLRALPSGGSASEGRSLRDGLSGLREVIGAFFTKRHIWYYIAFIILYRLGEGFVMKIVRCSSKPIRLRAVWASRTSRSAFTTGHSVPGLFFWVRCWRATISHTGACDALFSYYAVSLISRSRSMRCWHGCSLSRCGSWAGASCWNTSATGSDSWALRCL